MDEVLIRKRSVTTGLFAVILALLSPRGAKAADSEELLAAFDQIDESQLDTTTTMAVRQLVVEHQDLRIILDSGRFAFLEPLVIDHAVHMYGGYFEGQGRFQFKPPVRIERDQLMRIGTGRLGRRHPVRRRNPG